MFVSNVIVIPTVTFEATMLEGNCECLTSARKQNSSLSDPLFLASVVINSLMLCDIVKLDDPDAAFCVLELTSNDEFSPVHICKAKYVSLSYV